MVFHACPSLRPCNLSIRTSRTDRIWPVSFTAVDEVDSIRTQLEEIQPETSCPLEVRMSFWKINHFLFRYNHCGTWVWPEGDVEPRFQGAHAGAVGTRFGAQFFTLNKNKMAIDDPSASSWRAKKTRRLPLGWTGWRSGRTRLWRRYVYTHRATCNVSLSTFSINTKTPKLCKSASVEWLKFVLGRSLHISVNMMSLELITK